MRKVRLIALCCLCLTAIFSGCSSQNERNQRVKEWMQSNDKIKVLSTIGMIDDLVQIIGGDRVDGLVLINGQLDPHSYQLVKGDDEKLAFADIIFYNGLSLEHGPSLKKTLNEKKNTIALGDEIQKRNPSLILTYNGQIDPHIWMDVSLWKKTIPHIVKALSQYDPGYAETFKRNGQTLEAKLNYLHAKIKDQLQSIPEGKRYVVTSHDAFNYFAKTYLSTKEERKNGTWQKRFAAPEGLSPDSQLSTGDIKDIVDHLDKHRIHVIFPESNVSRDSIKKIVESGREKGLDLWIAECPLYADAMGPKGSNGDTYMKMVNHNAELIGLYLRDYNPRTVPKCY
jgi:manganese/zinc/iron transport system substrate-binding protein